MPCKCGGKCKPEKVQKPKTPKEYRGIADQLEKEAITLLEASKWYSNMADTLDRGST